MVDYSLIYRISAKIEHAKKGFETIQSSFGDMTEKGKIMGRRMGNLLTLQKLAWLGFSYIVAKSIYGVMQKSAMLQSFLSAWGIILGAIMDSLLAPWSKSLGKLTEKFVDLQKAIDDLPDFAKKFLAGGLAVAGLIVALGALATIIKTLVLPGLIAIGAVFGGIIAKISTVGLAFLALSGIVGLVVGIIGGLLLGSLVVWIMMKTGVLEAISEIGRKFEAAHPIIMDFVRVLTLPLAALGAIVIYLVSGRWQEIPGAIKDVLTQAYNSFFNILDKITGVFFSAFEKMTGIDLSRFYTIGKKIIDKILSGLAGLGSKLLNFIKDSIPGLDEIFHITPQVVAIGAHYVDLINRGIAKTKIAGPKFGAVSLESPFGGEAGSGALMAKGAGSVDNRRYDISITVPITAEIKEEGKSMDEIATEVANLLSFKMGRIL